MRSLPGFAFAIAVTLISAATAQTAAPPRPAGPATTTGMTPREAAGAPTGHRQPRAVDVPDKDASVSPVSPYDQDIDRHLQICRGC